jgi:hypothetical protein
MLCAIIVLSAHLGKDKTTCEGFSLKGINPNNTSLIPQPRMSFKNSGELGVCSFDVHTQKSGSKYF